MVRDPKKTRYAKLKRGTLRKLAEKLDLPYVQLAGRISGSRPVSDENAKILSEKFATIGIEVPVLYWKDKLRGKLRKLVVEWYNKEVPHDR